MRRIFVVILLFLPLILCTRFPDGRQKVERLIEQSDTSKSKDSIYGHVIQAGREVNGSLYTGECENYYLHVPNSCAQLVAELNATGGLPTLLVKKQPMGKMQMTSRRTELSLPARLGINFASFYTFRSFGAQKGIVARADGLYEGRWFIVVCNQESVQTPLQSLESDRATYSLRVSLTMDPSEDHHRRKTDTLQGSPPSRQIPSVVISSTVGRDSDRLTKGSHIFLRSLVGQAEGRRITSKSPVRGNMSADVIPSAMLSSADLDGLIDAHTIFLRSLPSHSAIDMSQQRDYYGNFQKSNRDRSVLAARCPCSDNRVADDSAILWRLISCMCVLEGFAIFGLLRLWKRSAASTSGSNLKDEIVTPQTSAKTSAAIECAVQHHHEDKQEASSDGSNPLARSIQKLEQELREMRQKLHEKTDAVNKAQTTAAEATELLTCLREEKEQLELDNIRLQNEVAVERRTGEALRHQLEGNLFAKNPHDGFTTDSSTLADDSAKEAQNAHQYDSFVVERKKRLELEEQVEELKTSLRRLREGTVSEAGEQKGKGPSAQDVHPLSEGQLSEFTGDFVEPAEGMADDSVDGLFSLFAFDFLDGTEAAPQHNSLPVASQRETWLQMNSRELQTESVFTETAPSIAETMVDPWTIASGEIGPAEQRKPSPKKKIADKPGRQRGGQRRRREKPSSNLND